MRVCKEDESLQASPNIRVVFINAAAWQKCTDGELRAFSCYVMTGAASTPLAHLVAERTALVKKDNSKEAGFMGIYEAVDQIVARKAPEWLAQGDTQGFASGTEHLTETKRVLFLLGGVDLV